MTQYYLTCLYSVTLCSSTTEFRFICLAGPGPAGLAGPAAEEADGTVIQAMGEFDLGEEQPGEGGEGFMDLGAAIGNKVGQHGRPLTPEVVSDMAVHVWCHSIPFHRQRHLVALPSSTEC